MLTADRAPICLQNFPWCFCLHILYEAVDNATIRKCETHMFCGATLNWSLTSSILAITKVGRRRFFTPNKLKKEIKCKQQC